MTTRHKLTRDQVAAVAQELGTAAMCGHVVSLPIELDDHKGAIINVCDGHGDALYTARIGPGGRRRVERVPA